MKIGTQPHLRVVISNSVLDFQNFYPKLPFWGAFVPILGKFGPKIKNDLFSMKIGTQSKFEGADFKSSTRF